MEAHSPVLSLREHVTRLRGQGLLVHVKEKVDIDEMLHILDKAGKVGLLFEDIAGYGSPAVFNLLSDAERLASALGVEEDLSDLVVERFDSPKKPSRYVDMELKGPLIPSLSSMPVPKYYEYDAGPYITSSVLFARSPGSGVMNASVHRIRVIDDSTGVVRLVEGRHLHRIYTEAVKLGKDLEVFVEIGANPIVEFAASYQAPLGIYEAWLANSLASGTLPFTNVDGFELPLGCEVLLRGRILTDGRETDRMVDMLGLYDKERSEPMIEFHEMYVHEPGTIYRGLLPGGPEHRFLMSFPVKVKLEKGLKDVVPGVKRVVLTEGGGSWLHAVIQMERGLEGDPRTAIMRAFALHPSLKFAVTVDDDIDPEDPEDVEFAISTRVQASRDIIVISRVRGSSLDPSSDQRHLTTDKWGLDATIPTGEDYTKYLRARVLGKSNSKTRRILNEILGR